MTSNKNMDSLIDEAHALIDQTERRLKQRRLKDKAETYIGRLVWIFIGILISTIYYGFHWYQFRYLSTQLWNKLIAWCLT